MIDLFHAFLHMIGLCSDRCNHPNLLAELPMALACGWWAWSWVRRRICR